MTIAVNSAAEVVTGCWRRRPGDRLTRSLSPVLSRDRDRPEPINIGGEMMGCFTRLVYLVFVVVLTAAMVGIGAIVHACIEDGVQPPPSLGLTATEVELILWGAWGLIWLFGLTVGYPIIVKE